MRGKGVVRWMGGANEKNRLEIFFSTPDKCITPYPDTGYLVFAMYIIESHSYSTLVMKDDAILS